MKNVLLLIVLKSALVFGQSHAVIELPLFDDKYSSYVKKLEAGETGIDYQDFRFSFLESEQFQVAAKKFAVFDSLEKEMYVQMKRAGYQEVINITKQMLSIDYTSMKAHKILRQTYKILGDTSNASKYKAIQFGLLESIVRKGDGKSCETGWPVIQLSEEYFILGILEAKLISQNVERQGCLCDRMELEIDGQAKTYYFKTSKVFEGYKKLGIE